MIVLQKCYTLDGSFCLYSNKMGPTTLDTYYSPEISLAASVFIFCGE